MPQRSQFQIDIPACNVLSYLFPTNARPLETPIWLDAECPKQKALSPSALLTWVRRLGAGLDALKVQQDEIVLVLSTNHIFVPVAYLGIAGSGRIFSGCNPAYQVDEIAFQIENSKASLMLVEPSLLDSGLAAAAKAKFPRDRVYLFSDTTCSSTNGCQDWSHMLASEQDAERWKWPDLSPGEAKNRTAVLNYSSGTTGLPKGVMISHLNIIANVEQSIFMRNLERPDSSPSDERWLGFLPLYHAYGQLWSISAACRTNTPCYFLRKFDFEMFLRHIQTHRVTHIQTAPPLLVMLGKRPETQKYDLSSLENILCGAAPLSRELQNEVSSKLNVKIVQTWGMTEVTCSCLHVPGHRDDRSGSVGLIDPNSEIKLIGDDGKEAPVGERGEIYVRGPNVCLGYWRNEAATKETFDDEGFLKSGDVAISDSKGFFWIVDRKKELIKVRGFQVAPAELEAALLENENVADAAVVGMNLEHEERPRAYIQLQEDAQGKVKETDIQKWIAERVAKHKCLTGGVAFVEEVPKSPSGKILRKILREWAARDSKKFRPSDQPRSKL